MIHSQYIKLYNIPKEIITYLFLFIICGIFFISSIKNRKDNLIHYIPNMISMFVLGPIFLIVGAFNTKYKILYLILSLISLGLFLSIMHEIIKDKKPVTIGRLFYLLIFIPLLMYIALKQDNSSIYANRLLFIIGLIYITYNINVVCFNNIPKLSIFDGLPEHPVRRLLPLLQQ